jgi:hypothetical protein
MMREGSEMAEGQTITLGMDPLVHIYQRWVHPCCLHLLHGNFRSMCLAQETSPEREELIRWFRRALSEITPDVIGTLLQQTEWRAQLTASWFCGLKGWREFRQLLGQFLVESQVCFAGQGYCVALACFGDRPSADYLCAYLDRWLPQVDKFYDQHRAMPALRRIDAQLGTNFASRYLGKGGLWQRWAARSDGRANADSLESREHDFNQLCRCALEYFGPGRNLPAPVFWPSTVLDLAKALFDGQGCRLILADSLEESGHPEMAQHFRQEEWHPKGCWLLDRILSKDRYSDNLYLPGFGAENQRSGVA